MVGVMGRGNAGKKKGTKYGTLWDKEEQKWKQSKGRVSARIFSGDLSKKNRGSQASKSGWIN